MEREAPTPLYAQIAATLRDEIRASRFEPSGRLPSEEELRTRFKVSRVTIRLALAELERDGLIDRRKGKGTFTQGKQVRHSLDLLRSFHESLKAQGFEATMRFIEAEENIAHESRPGLSIRVVRLHLADGKPIAIGTSFLPASLAGQHWEALGNLPLYAIIEKQMGTAVATAEFSVGMGLADQRAARELLVAEGQPLLLLERSSYAANDDLLDLTIFQIRPEQYQFTVTSHYRAAE